MYKSDNSDVRSKEKLIKIRRADICIVVVIKKLHFYT